MLMKKLKILYEKLHQIVKEMLRKNKKINYVMTNSNKKRVLMKLDITDKNLVLKTI